MEDNSSSLPLISILVPIRNAEDYLAKCIESLVSQTYTNLEFVFADNSSTDGSLDIVNKVAGMDSRFKVFSCDVGGVGATRNFLLEKASADYVLFVDVDDFLPEDAVETLYQVLYVSNADMVCGSSYLKLGNRITIRPIPPFHTEKAVEIHKYFVNCLTENNKMWGKLYKKSIFDGIVFPDDKLYEELTVMPRLLDNVKKFVAVNMPVYTRVKNSLSLMGRADLSKQFDGLEGRISNALFYEKRYPEVAPYAYDEVLEFCFCLLGRIESAGAKENQAKVDYVIECIRRYSRKAAKKSLRMKLKIMLSIIMPKAACKYEELTLI